jgi:hypothetical protein
MPRAAQHQEAAPPEIADMQPQPEEGSWEQVRGLVDTIQPGDWQRLVVFLQTYPSFQDQILGEAQTVLGNATVQRALQQLGVAPQMQGATDTQDAAAARALYADPGVDQGAAPAESAAETMAELDAAPAAPEQSDVDKVLLLVTAVETAEDLAALIKGHPQYRQQIVEAARQQLGDADIERAIAMADDVTVNEPEDQAPAPEPDQGPAPGEAPPTTATEPEPTAEPAWVTQARAYNFSDEHVQEAVEFNELTKGACLGQGELDPYKVAAWQQTNGLEPNGRIDGPTLELARSFAKTTGEAPERDEELFEDLE